jgi:hypothetical protein
MNNLTQAMFSPSFPGNPIPFAKGLVELVRSEGTNSIQTDEAKSILWILMAQAYGQLATIDLHTEWSRLDKTTNVSNQPPGIMETTMEGNE